MTDESFAPPPLPNFGAAKQEPDEWYYVANGARRGPTTATAIANLLRNKEIEADTQVWRTGMPEWKGLRESDLAELVAAEPPAVSPLHIGNGYVWTLAFVPLVVAIIDAAMAASNQEAVTRFWLLHGGHLPDHVLVPGLPPPIPLTINGLLGWLDDRKLKQAGYGSWVTRATAVLLQPVYLFLRAKRLKQRPTYAIAWIICVVVGILIYASAEG